MKTLYFCMMNGHEKIPKEWVEMKYFCGDNSDPESARSMICENSETHIHRMALPYIRDENHTDYLERVMLTAVEKYLEVKPDIVVTGHTVSGDMVVRSICGLPEKLQPKLIIRFSMYYGTRHAPYQETLPPMEAGFNLDLFKDHFLLYDLMSFKPLIEAVDSGKNDSIKAAIEKFNENQPQPIRIFSL